MAVDLQTNFSCKDRKNTENIIVSNEIDIKQKSSSLDEKLVWAQRGKTWEKVDSSNLLDSSIVDIIRGNSKEVILSWNYGDNLNAIEQVEKHSDKMQTMEEIKPKPNYSRIESPPRETEKQVEYEQGRMPIQRPQYQTVQAHQDMGYSTQYNFKCGVFFRSIIWMCCLALSGTVIMYFSTKSFQEIINCPALCLLFALPVILYIVMTSMPTSNYQLNQPQLQYPQSQPQTMQYQTETKKEVVPIKTKNYVEQSSSSSQPLIGCFIALIVGIFLIWYAYFV